MQAFNSGGKKITVVKNKKPNTSKKIKISNSLEKIISFKHGINVLIRNGTYKGQNGIVHEMTQPSYKITCVENQKTNFQITKSRENIYVSSKYIKKITIYKQNGFLQFGILENQNSIKHIDINKYIIMDTVDEKSINQFLDSISNIIKSGTKLLNFNSNTIYIEPQNILKNTYIINNGIYLGDIGENINNIIHKNKLKYFNENEIKEYPDKSIEIINGDNYEKKKFNQDEYKYTPKYISILTINNIIIYEINNKPIQDSDILYYDVKVKKIDKDIQVTEINTDNTFNGIIIENGKIIYLNNIQFYEITEYLQGFKWLYEYSNNNFNEIYEDSNIFLEDEPSFEDLQRMSFEPTQLEFNFDNNIKNIVKKAKLNMDYLDTYTITNNMIFIYNKLNELHGKIMLSNDKKILLSALVYAESFSMGKGFNKKQSFKEFINKLSNDFILNPNIHNNIIDTILLNPLTFSIIDDNNTINIDNQIEEILKGKDSIEIIMNNALILIKGLHIHTKVSSYKNKNPHNIFKVNENYVKLNDNDNTRNYKDLSNVSMKELIENNGFPKILLDKIKFEEYDQEGHLKYPEQQNSFNNKSYFKKQRFDKEGKLRRSFMDSNIEERIYKENLIKIPKKREIGITWNSYMRLKISEIKQNLVEPNLYYKKFIIDNLERTPYLQKMDNGYLKSKIQNLFNYLIELAKIHEPKQPLLNSIIMSNKNKLAGISEKKRKRNNHMEDLFILDNMKALNINTNNDDDYLFENENENFFGDYATDDNNNNNN